MPLRQPIVTVLGHVDVGKTLLLDKIRGTAVMAREVGAMTAFLIAVANPTHRRKLSPDGCYCKVLQLSSERV
ncbi:MAG: hypothetical protein ACUVQ5_00865 [Candidatus Methanomethylicaceae archaeon]